MKASSRPERQRSFSALTLSAACALAFAACSASSNGGTGGSSGSGTGGSSSTGTGGSSTGSGGSSTGSGGSSATGGSTGTGGSSTTGTGGTSTTGGSTGTGGSSTTGTGGTSAGGHGGSSTTGTGGSATTGTGGSSTTGTGGTSAGGHGGSSTTGTGGSSTTGTGGSSSTGTGGSAGSGSCPANATFCSGFETNALPSGAVYNVNAAPGDWTRDFAVDTTQKHAGASSLLVKNQSASGSSGSAYRMLAVPATPGAFWVRFWIQSDMPLGSVEHNAFAGGSIGSGPNDLMIEFAEDVGIAFNTSDSDVWPTGYGRLTNGTNPYTVPAMTWTCVEISYDGTNRVQQLFINNTQLINATGYPSATENLTYFKFGFDAYHGPARQVWYDDVAVAPTRIGGCG